MDNLHGVEIRAADIFEFNAVFELWLHTPGLVLRAEDVTEQLQPLLIDDRLRLYVARRQSKIVGAVLVGQDGRRGYLYHLVVAESLRGQGLGRALVRAGLQELAAQGISRSHVFVTVDNVAAQHFWSHLGWQEREELKVFSFSTPV